MNYYTNITVTMKQFGQNEICFSKLGRLILDPKDSSIYTGDARVFSTDVPPTSRWFEIGIDNIESVHLFDRAYLIKKEYYMEIQLKRPLPSGYVSWIGKKGLTEGSVLVFYTSRSEGERFLENYNSLQRDIEEPIKNQDHYILIPFKSSGKINLVEFAKKNKGNIYKCHPNKDIYIQPLSDKLSLAFLKGIVRDYIKDNKLNGVIDEQTNEYTDRDFIVRKQKVVNVNVDIDFSTLLQQLGNKGIILTSIQCPQCQAECTVPPEGTSFQCQSCETVTEITDVFEKFKSFLT